MADDGSVPFVSAGDVTHGYDDTDTSNGSGGGVGGGGSVSGGGSGGSSAKSSSSWKGKAKQYAGAAVDGTQRYSQQLQAAADRLTEQDRGVQSLRQGGRVKKTGLIHAHRGEEVVRPEEADKVRKFLKKEHGRGHRPGAADTGRMGDAKMAERKGDPKMAERKGDPKMAERKGDPKNMAAKFDPKRFEKKADVTRTAKKAAPKRMAGKMGRHKKGRGM